MFDAMKMTEDGKKESTAVQLVPSVFYLVCHIFDALTISVWRKSSIIAFSFSGQSDHVDFMIIDTRFFVFFILYTFFPCNSSIWWDIVPSFILGYSFARRMVVGKLKSGHHSYQIQTGMFVVTEMTIRWKEERWRWLSRSFCLLSWLPFC